MFDAEEYAHLDNLITADMHMVCPKVITFKGPEGNRGDGHGLDHLGGYLSKLSEEPQTMKQVSDLTWHVISIHIHKYKYRPGKVPFAC
jgi:hypothetical protein